MRICLIFESAIGPEKPWYLPVGKSSKPYLSIRRVFDWYVPDIVSNLSAMRRTSMVFFRFSWFPYIYIYTLYIYKLHKYVQENSIHVRNSKLRWANDRGVAIDGLHYGTSGRFHASYDALTEHAGFLNPRRRSVNYRKVTNSHCVRYRTCDYRWEFYGTAVSVPSRKTLSSSRE